MDDLRKKLQQLRRFPSEDGTSTPNEDDTSITLPFVPKRPLYALLTRDLVETALADPTFHFGLHERDVYVDHVFHRARRIFAIFVELRAEYKLKLCLEKNLRDKNFPILEEKRILEIFPESASHFQRLQWEYFPLKFQQGMHKDLSSSYILPFIRNTKLSSGGFSTVFKVTIHPSYQDWDKPATSVRFLLG